PAASSSATSGRWCSCRCCRGWPTDEAVRAAVRARAALGAASEGAGVARRAQLRRGDRVPGDAGSDAGADVPGPAAPRVPVRDHQPGVLAGRRGGRLPAGPLRLRGGQADAGRAGLAGADRRRGGGAARDRRAFAVEGVLAAGDRRLHPDPAEDLHLGQRRGRRADAAVPGGDAGRPRQARLPAGAGDPAGWRARRARPAPLDRAGRLGGAGAAGGAGRLAAVAGTCGMMGGMRMSRSLVIAIALVLLAGCGRSHVPREGGHGRSARGHGPVRVSQPKYGATVVVRKGQTVYRIATENGITALDLALWNDIRPPYTIYPGQRLRLYPD